MPQEQEGNIGVVVRPDGSVPFDADVHPTVKKAILQHLVDTGHHIEPIAGTPHYKLRSGPLAPKAA